MPLSRYRNPFTYLYHDSTNPIEFSGDHQLTQSVLCAITTLLAQSAAFTALQPASNLLTHDAVEYSLTSAKNNFSTPTFYSYGFTFLSCSIFPWLVSRDQESIHSRATGCRALSYLLVLGILSTMFFYEENHHTDSLNQTLIHDTLPLVLAACCINSISKIFCLRQLDVDEKNAPLLG